jgi:RHS repeat-associated protein
LTETVTQRYPVSRTYIYYENSSRLKSNGKYSFSYDPNGNLIKKETISDEKIIWKYEYDLFNRLVKVTKNDSVVAGYTYDEAGLRVKKQGVNSAIYYTFDTGGNVLFEQENREYMEYVYVLGKHFARVDGNLDNLEEKTKYFYHTDHLGSTVLVTDEAGQQVWGAEYTPFGKRVSKEGELEHAAKFTGKDLDEDTGLYYFNARWYDQGVGRFVSEDQMNDPNNPNLYTYCRNNPLTITDPTGNTSLSEIGLSSNTTGLSQVELDKDRDIGIGYYSPSNPNRSAQIIWAEKNIPGFQYDYQLRESSVERQIQLHYYIQAFIKEMKAESWDVKLINRIFAGDEKTRIEEAKLGFLKLFNYLDAQTTVYNIFNLNNKKDYSYSNDELITAATDMQFFGFASLILMNELGKLPVYVVGESPIAKNPLPNFNNAKIDPRKLTEYALNPTHHVGGSKARVFESALGYNQSNAEALLKQVYEKLPQSEAVLGELNQYGQRYTVDMPITGPNGKTVTVRTGWIFKPGAVTPELTTIYVK